MDAFGKVWRDIGQKDSSLNLLLSSQLFRHDSDLLPTVRLAESEGRGFGDDSAVGRAMTQEELRRNQVTDETLFDMV